MFRCYINFKEEVFAKSSIFHQLLSYENDEIMIEWLSFYLYFKSVKHVYERGKYDCYWMYVIWVERYLTFKSLYNPLNREQQILQDSTKYENNEHIIELF